MNPYKQEAFVGTKDFQKAMERRADTAYLLETEPASATAAEIAEMVAYNELPAEGESGYVYLAAKARASPFPKTSSSRRGGIRNGADPPSSFSHESPSFSFSRSECQLGAEMVNARFGKCQLRVEMAG